MADLVWFCLPVSGLQVEDFLDPLHREDVVISSHAFLETKPLEKLAKPVKGDVRV